MSEEFAWPWFYHFPPFFTLQTNAEVRRSQIQSWCSLVLRWAQHTSTTGAGAGLAVFSNPALPRSLPPDAIAEVLNELHKRGNLEWDDRAKTR